jgi:hypothetical protein
MWKTLPINMPRHTTLTAKMPIAAQYEVRSNQVEQEMM